MHDLESDLTAAGSVAALARIVGVSQPTIRKRLKNEGIDPAAVLKGHRIAGRSATARSEGVSLTSPHPDQIDFQKAAQALSRIDRHGGHGPVFYSYAEHAFRVAKRVAKSGCDRTTQIGSLLRYVPVAYVGHIPESVRRVVGPRIVEVDNAILNTVLEAAGVRSIDVDWECWADAEIYFASLSKGQVMGMQVPVAPLGMTPEIAAASFESLLRALIAP